MKNRFGGYIAGALGGWSIGTYSSIHQPVMLISGLILMWFGAWLTFTN